jgi:hypothetical protein
VDCYSQSAINLNIHCAMSQPLLLGLFFVMAKRYDKHPQRTRSVTKGRNLVSDVGGEAEFQLGAKSVKDIRRGDAL